MMKHMNAKRKFAAFVTAITLAAVGTTTAVTACAEETTEAVGEQPAVVEEASVEDAASEWDEIMQELPEEVQDLLRNEQQPEQSSEEDAVTAFFNEVEAML